MIVKLLNVPFSNDDLNFYNTFQKTDFEDVIGLSSIGEIDVAANMISTTEMILNIDEVDLQNKFNYVCVIDELFFEKRKTYWFVESIDRSKSKTKPRVRIVLDSISSFGDLVHSELDGKYVFLERAHFDRWILDNNKIYPNINEKSLWYFKDEFNDTVDINSEINVKDFDNQLDSQTRDIGWGILNIPNLRYLYNQDRESVIITADKNDVNESFHTIPEGIIVPVDMKNHRIGSLNNYSKNNYHYLTNGQLTNLYYSPIMFKKISSININETGLFEFDINDLSLIGVGDVTTTQVREINNIQIKGDTTKVEVNLFNKYKFIKDLTGKTLSFSWENELKIINNRNFETYIGFTGISDEWDINIEYFLLQYSKNKIFNNNDSEGMLNLEFYLKITTTGATIDSYIKSSSPFSGEPLPKAFKNPNWFFQFTLIEHPIFTSQYDEYVKSNKSQISTAKHQASENAKWAIAGGALNIFSGIGKVAAGAFVGTSGSPVGGVPAGLAGGAVAGSGVSGIVGGIQSMATANFEKQKIQSQLNDKQRLNSIIKDPSINHLNSIIGVAEYNKLSYIVYKKRHNSILEAKARYHLKFGYQINDNLEYSDKLYGRYLFNFIQISDIKIFLNKTNLEKDIINLISQKFELGLRIWNDYDEINNYNLENWENSVYNIIK